MLGGDQIPSRIVKYGSINQSPCLCICVYDNVFAVEHWRVEGGCMYSN